MTATMAAIEYHTGAMERPVAVVRMEAAKNAADEWPLGKLDVDGRRTGKRGSPVSVGRVRRNYRFTPWFTIKLSTPSIADIAMD